MWPSRRFASSCKCSSDGDLAECNARTVHLLDAIQLLSLLHTRNISRDITGKCWLYLGVRNCGIQKVHWLCHGIHSVDYSDGAHSELPGWKAGKHSTHWLSDFRQRKNTSRVTGPAPVYQHYSVRYVMWLCILPDDSLSQHFDVMYRLVFDCQWSRSIVWRLIVKVVCDICFRKGHATLRSSGEHIVYIVLIVNKM